MAMMEESVMMVMAKINDADVTIAIALTKR